MLYFLDKLCLFYEREYLFKKTSVDSASSHMLTDKAVELAEEYGLSSKAYRSCLVDEKLLIRLTKVSPNLQFYSKTTMMLTMVLIKLSCRSPSFCLGNLGLNLMQMQLFQMEGCVNQFYLFLLIVQKILYYLRTHSVSSNCIFMNLYHIQLYIW